MGDKTKGAIRKFFPLAWPAGCGASHEWWVLDLTHDPFADAARRVFLASGGALETEHPRKVGRTDGSSNPGGKHYDCEYAVICLHCDYRPAVIATLMAYADACSSDYPLLAADLRRWCADPDVARLIAT